MTVSLEVTSLFEYHNCTFPGPSLITHPKLSPLQSALVRTAKKGTILRQISSLDSEPYRRPSSNSFRLRTYENQGKLHHFSTNRPRRISTYKIPSSNSFRLRTCEKNQGGVPFRNPFECLTLGSPVTYGAKCHQFAADPT